MVLIKFEAVTDVKAKVIWAHWNPVGLTDEEKAGSLEVSDIPDVPPVPAYKTAVLYVNPADQSLWYEFEDRPLTDKERIEQLEEMNKQLFATINYILGV